MLLAKGSLIKIHNGTAYVSITDPDPESWSPVNEPVWTTNSGRVASGLAVGSRQYFKYKIPLRWTMLSMSDAAEIQLLIENNSDFFMVKFYHQSTWITKTVYAGTFTPSGIVKIGNGEIYYKSCSVDLIER